MSDNEVNKIIAEFMGFISDGVLMHLYKDDGSIVFEANCDYTESLDALVPVWEKMKSFRIVGVTFEDKKRGWRFLVEACSPQIWGFESFNLQQAASHATAKAILKLKEQENGQ